jgi:serine/threonine-protein kinase HipA
MLSALTLLRSGDTHQDRDRWSYVLLAEELRRLCANPKVDAPELFRRMVFNALISNIDDHPRNHAVIAIGNDWKLSPAYDVTPTPLVSLEQRYLAMACGDRGRIAHIDNLLSQSERFLLSADAARRIIEGMEATVHQRWYEIARNMASRRATARVLLPASATRDFGCEPKRASGEDDHGYRHAGGHFP